MGLGRKSRHSRTRGKSYLERGFSIWLNPLLFSLGPRRASLACALFHLVSVRCTLQQWLVITTTAKEEDGMSDDCLQIILQAMHPKANQWFGGPSPAGSLRNVSLDLAVRRFEGLQHCIWELALHIAYWEYAVRRMLERGLKGGFSRSPSNWPALPETPTEETWKADRRLVKQERDALIQAIRSFDVNQLGEPSSDRSKNTYADVLSGIIQHSTYHTGQITLLKRLGSSSRF